MTPGRRTAAGKVLDVLAAFGPESRALTLSELARSCALPVSTAHRIVTELVQWGGLERDTTGRYRVGLRLWGLEGVCLGC